MARVLVVDDEMPLRRLLRGVLADDGHEVTEACNTAQARELIGSAVFDVVMTDQRMPDGTGTELVAFCRECDPALPVVMITAFASVDLAVEVMRGGAFDFIAKPFQPEVVRSCVRRAAEQARLRRDNSRLRGEIRELRTTDLVGSGPAMQAVREQIRKVAPTKATVLIQGETGTGKELVARAIHDGSPRSGAPFLAVNCAAMAETLLESELFGHEKGAFTGADRPRSGLFEAADGGTLFLDEAGDMPATLQAKLLRVLMDGRFCRLGSTTERHADVRVIAASHRNLRKAVDEGSFREDLYYRLAVFTIHLSPLRERPEDLDAITSALLGRIRRDLGVQALRVSPEAFERLAAYRFPGNIRELRNILERAAILAEGPEIRPADLVLGGAGEAERRSTCPEEVAAALLRCGLPEGGLKGALEQLERAIITRALQEAGGVQAEAARRLGMSKSDFFYRVQKYGLAEKA